MYLATYLGPSLMRPSIDREDTHLKLGWAVWASWIGYLLSGMQSKFPVNSNSGCCEVPSNPLFFSAARCWLPKALSWVPLWKLTLDQSCLVQTHIHGDCPYPKTAWTQPTGPAPVAHEGHNFWVRPLRAAVSHQSTLPSRGFLCISIVLQGLLSCTMLWLHLYCFLLERWWPSFCKYSFIGT